MSPIERPLIVIFSPSFPRTNDAVIFPIAKSWSADFAQIIFDSLSFSLYVAIPIVSFTTSVVLIISVIFL